MDRFKNRLSTLVLLFAIPVMGISAPPGNNDIDSAELPAVPVGVTKKAKQKSKKGEHVAYENKGRREGIEYYKNTKINLAVVSGVTELVPIARNYMNRIITPFDNPKIVTVNPIEFKKEGSSIFVTTSSEKPVGIYIISNDKDETDGISLALVPKAIPPRTIKLKWAAVSDSSAGAYSKRAKRWEESLPYVSTLGALLEDVARGKIPRGYSLTKSKKGFVCDMGGVDFNAGQRLVGSHFSVIVMRATNITDGNIEIDEQKCYQKGVAAVSSWPRTLLHSGESTEIYVAVSNDIYDEKKGSDMRPSLLSLEVK